MSACWTDATPLGPAAVHVLPPRSATLSLLLGWILGLQAVQAAAAFDCNTPLFKKHACISPPNRLGACLTLCLPTLDDTLWVARPVCMLPSCASLREDNTIQIPSQFTKIYVFKKRSLTTDNASTPICKLGLSRKASLSITMLNGSNSHLTNFGVHRRSSTVAHVASTHSSPTQHQQILHSRGTAAPAETVQSTLKQQQQHRVLGPRSHPESARTLAPPPRAVATLSKQSVVSQNEHMHRFITKEGNTVSAMGKGSQWLDLMPRSTS